jgi:hypothetical protein
VWRWCMEERLKLKKSKPWKKNASSSTKGPSFICLPSYFPLPIFLPPPLLHPLSMSQFGGEDPSEENLQQKKWNILDVITLDASFCEYGRCYFPKSYCCNDKMVKPRRSICVIVHHVIFHMSMAKLNHLWQLCLLNYVVCCANNS